MTNFPFKIGDCVYHPKDKEQKMYISDIHRKAPKSPFNLPAIIPSGKVKCKFKDKEGNDKEEIFDFRELLPCE